MTLSSMSHRRAAFWLSQIERDPRYVSDDMVDVLRGLPLMIRRHGLALAIVSSAAAGTRGVERGLALSCLREWLCQEFGPAPLPAGADDASVGQPKAFAEWVLQQEREGGLAAYASVVAEAMSFLEWGKQLVTALNAEAADRTVTDASGVDAQTISQESQL